MARRTRNDADEYNGTDGPVDGTGGESSAIGIDPDTAIGAGDRDNRGTEFDPNVHRGREYRNRDGSWERKRGRGAGTGKTKRSPSSKGDLKTAIEALAGTLVVVHAGLAGFTNTPELQIDDEEGNLLATATANVFEQFNFMPDPKIAAVVGLVMAAGKVYGPRVYLINARRSAEAKARKANKNGEGVATVFNPDGTTATAPFNHVN